MDAVINGLVELTQGLGPGAAWALFGALLLILLAKAGAEADKDAAAGKVLNTNALVEAYKHLADLKPRLTDAEYEAAKTAILRQHGVTETQAAAAVQNAAPTNDEVEGAGLLGALTPPGLYTLLALVTGSFPSGFGEFVGAAAFLAIPVYGGVKAVTGKPITPKQAYWQGFTYSLLVLFVEFVLVYFFSSIPQQSGPLGQQYGPSGRQLGPTSHQPAPSGGRGQLQICNPC